MSVSPFKTANLVKALELLDREDDLAVVRLCKASQHKWTV